MENQYGIGIANRYDLFLDQDDMTDSFETVVSKKKKDKTKEALTTPLTAAPKSSEKENKAQPKAQPQQQQGTTTQSKAQPQKDQRRGIKEQNNAGINKKDNGESKFPPISHRFLPKFGFFKIFTKNVLFNRRKFFFFSQPSCICVRESLHLYSWEWNFSKRPEKCQMTWKSRQQIGKLTKVSPNCQQIKKMFTKMKKSLRN